MTSPTSWETKDIERASAFVYEFGFPKRPLENVSGKVLADICKFWEKEIAMACKEILLTERQKIREATKKLRDIRNGWSANESGECCEKCALSKPDGRADALKAVVGCKDPFQMNCACHLQNRVNSVLTLLDET
jgi:hypothetical protein